MVGLGTGIGTKFLIDGVLVRGVNGFAGEAGHMTVDRNGPPHVTGLPGAWEMFGSGSALGTLARRMALDGSAPVATRSSRAAPTPLPVKPLRKRSTMVTKARSIVLDAYAEQVAIGVANLIMVLDPQRVILGGGVSELGEPLRSRVEAAAQRLVVGAAYRPGGAGRARRAR